MTAPPMHDPDQPDSGPQGRAPLIGCIIGGAIMLFAFRGILLNDSRTVPFNLAFWVIGPDLVHDVIVAPIAFGLAALVVRVVPKPVQAPVLWAGATSLILSLYSVAFLRGYGRKASVPSLLNRNYGSGLLTALALVWVGAAIWGALRIRMARTRNNRPTEQGIDEQAHGIGTDGSDLITDARSPIIDG